MPDWNANQLSPQGIATRIMNEWPRVKAVRVSIDFVRTVDECLHDLWIVFEDESEIRTGPMRVTGHESELHKILNAHYSQGEEEYVP